MVQIHKRESKSLVDNYRPVSLLSVLGKVMESIFFKHVNNHLRDNTVSENQSGFLPGRSTVTHILEIYSLGKSVDRGKEVSVIFLDISKAFDRVWHKGLLYKLYMSGVSGGGRGYTTGLEIISDRAKGHCEWSKLIGVLSKSGCHKDPFSVLCYFYYL